MRVKPLHLSPPLYDLNYRRNTSFSAPGLRTMRLLSNQFLLVAKYTAGLEVLLNQWLFAQCKSLVAELKRAECAPKQSLLTDARLRCTVFRDKQRVVAYELEGGIYVLERIASSDATKDVLGTYVSMYTQQSGFKRFIHISDVCNGAASRERCERVLEMLSESPQLAMKEWLTQIVQRDDYCYMIGENVVEIGLQMQDQAHMMSVEASEAGSTVFMQQNSLQQSAALKTASRQPSNLQLRIPTQAGRSSQSTQPLGASGVMNTSTVEGLAQLLNQTAQTPFKQVKRSLMQTRPQLSIQSLQSLQSLQSFNSLAQVAEESSDDQKIEQKEQKPVKVLSELKIIARAGQMHRFITLASLAATTAVIYANLAESADLSRNRLSCIRFQECEFLHRLLLNDNKLQTIDLRVFAELRELDVSDNPLRALDISPCPHLERVALNRTYVQLLEVPPLERLTSISCYKSPIDSLQIAAVLPRLRTLDVSGTGISNLPMNMLPAIEQLYVHGTEAAKRVVAPPHVRVFRLNAYE